VAALVEHAQGQGKALSEPTLGEYHKFSPLFDKDVLGIMFVGPLHRGCPRRHRRRGAALKAARKRLAQR
jgi:hypothetical protein